MQRLWAINKHKNRKQLHLIGRVIKTETRKITHWQFIWSKTDSKQLPYLSIWKRFTINHPLQKCEKIVVSSHIFFQSIFEQDCCILPPMFTKLLLKNLTKKCYSADQNLITLPTICRQLNYLIEEMIYISCNLSKEYEKWRLKLSIEMLMVVGKQTRFKYKWINSQIKHEK